VGIYYLSGQGHPLSTRFDCPDLPGAGPGAVNRYLTTRLLGRVGLVWRGTRPASWADGRSKPGGPQPERLELPAECLVSKPYKQGPQGPAWFSGRLSVERYHSNIRSLKNLPGSLVIVDLLIYHLRAESGAIRTCGTPRACGLRSEQAEGRTGRWISGIAAYGTRLRR
jgi:hypothetical protein